MSVEIIAKDQQYWDAYYASQRKELTPPSQFAAFTLGEITADTLVCDVGCGMGRDALCFSSYGYHVVGIDGSEEAIALCKKTGASLSLDANFICCNVQDLVKSEALYNDEILKSAPSVLVYARFFLHAIPEENEDNLLAWIKGLSSATSAQVRFAAEFRTHRDATLPKSTAQHYRRFINPIDFVTKAVRQGFAVEYFVEGFGFAKHKNDDAHVARCIISL